MLAELSRREKEANIKPDPDVDVFMKVRKDITILPVRPLSEELNFARISYDDLESNFPSLMFLELQAVATQGREANVITDYVLKVVPLCSIEMS